ncbi:hypothetical protein FF38_05696 [Lucilia cuprina]|uniref:Uncharacterized protein n=1 Tax=Lucilia cuprina TaxID=7375 RepID=A0A0L0C8M0_LUCCU|nr:hypothetical protein FF38_05696 [Lucilia cuprina]
MCPLCGKQLKVFCLRIKDIHQIKPFNVLTILEERKTKEYETDHRFMIVTINNSGANWEYVIRCNQAELSSSLPSFTKIHLNPAAYFHINTVFVVKCSCSSIGFVGVCTCFINMYLYIVITPVYCNTILPVNWICLKKGHDEESITNKGNKHHKFFEKC